MRKLTNEEKHKRYLRKRNRHALRVVLTFSNGYAFRADNGLLNWLLSTIKAAICLIIGRVDNKTFDRECLVSYDEYFDIDHYEWTSIFVNPAFFKDWHVSITMDGE